MNNRSLHLFLLLLLSCSFLSAQDPGQVSLLARLSIADADGNPIRVQVGYAGGPLRGNAVAVYTLPTGEEIRDEMRDCLLSDANGIWRIDCKNPHYISWDHYYYDYSAFSERFTGGELQHFEILGDVEVQVRYSRRPPQ